MGGFERCLFYGADIGRMEGGMIRLYTRDRNRVLKKKLGFSLRTALSFYMKLNL